MNDIMNDIDAAFRMISTIPVSGDAVDAVAAARSKLRSAYAKLKEVSEKVEEPDDGNN